MLKNTKAWESNEAAIDRFLRSFPRYRSIEHFTATDFADYKILHPYIDPGPIKHFWEWLREQGLPLYQIAIDGYRAKRKTVNNLCLDDMLRLLDECSSTELKRKIIGAVKGEPSHIPVSKHWLREELRNAASRVGLPADFRLSRLKARVNKRLRQGLIEHYCQKLLDTLPVETEAASDTLGAIQLSPANEWSPVTYRNNYLPSGIQVVQQ
jgi:hypothetical protein